MTDAFALTLIASSKEKEDITVIYSIGDIMILSIVASNENQFSVMMNRRRIINIQIECLNFCRHFFEMFQNEVVRYFFQSHHIV